MSEIKYTICLTSYPKRFANLPKVLDSLWAQTIKPERIVLTLARNEWAAFCEMYPEGLNCDVLVIEKDVKVYKKFLYAMEKYAADPYNLFLCVDDDYIYSKDAASILCGVYVNEDRPISGNAYWHNGLKCHCGALSLVAPYVFRGWRECEQHFGKLESSDMFYTMLAAHNQVTYASAGNLLEHYAQPIEGEEKYTRHGQVQRTYLRFGKILGWF